METVRILFLLGTSRCLNLGPVANSDIGEENQKWVSLGRLKVGLVPGRRVGSVGAELCVCASEHLIQADWGEQLFLCELPRNVFQQAHVVLIEGAFANGPHWCVHRAL